MLKLLNDKLTKEVLTLPEIQTLIKKLFQEVEDLQATVKYMQQQLALSDHKDVIVGVMPNDWTFRI
jgi:hypothetical protein